MPQDWFVDLYDDFRMRTASFFSKTEIETHIRLRDRVKESEDAAIDRKYAADEEEEKEED